MFSVFLKAQGGVSSLTIVFTHVGGCVYLYTIYSANPSRNQPFRILSVKNLSENFLSNSHNYFSGLYFYSGRHNFFLFLFIFIIFYLKYSCFHFSLTYFLSSSTIPTVTYIRRHVTVHSSDVLVSAGKQLEFQKKVPKSLRWGTHHSKVFCSRELQRRSMFILRCACQADLKLMPYSFQSKMLWEF